MKDATRAVVANYWRRACQLDRRDLEQEAALAVLVADQTWQPAKGPREPYRNRAIVNRLREFVARMRCPATGNVHVLDRLWQLRADTLDSAVAIPAPSRNVEAMLDASRAAAIARGVLAVLRDGDLAAAVLLGETPPREVAASTGLPVSQIYQAAKRGREALAENPRLAELMWEMGE